MPTGLTALVIGVPFLVALLSIRPILLHHATRLSDDEVASLSPFLAAVLEKRLRAFVRREGCTLTSRSPIQRRLDLFEALRCRTPEKLRHTHSDRTDAPQNLKDLHDIRA